MIHNSRKRTFGHAPSEDSDQPAHSRSLSESSLDIFWIAKDIKFLHTDNEDFDQTAQMHRLD